MYKHLKTDGHGHVFHPKTVASGIGSPQVRFSRLNVARLRVGQKSVVELGAVEQRRSKLLVATVIINHGKTMGKPIGK